MEEIKEDTSIECRTMQGDKSNSDSLLMLDPGSISRDRGFMQLPGYHLQWIRATYSSSMLSKMCQRHEGVKVEHDIVDVNNHDAKGRLRLIPRYNREQKDGMC
jgi:hypothetical protein